PAAALSALLSAAASLPFANLTLPEPSQMALLIGFGIVNSSLGFALFLLGSRRIAPIETALISALDAPLAPLWVWIFFAETPSQATLLGAALVFAAVFGHIVYAARGHAPGA
ncbi:MAG: EamA family transporter, partial [Albidovulum sp.]